MQKAGKTATKAPPKLKPAAVTAPKAKKVEQPSSRARPMKVPHATSLTKDWMCLQLLNDIHVCGGNFSQAHKRFRGRNQQSPAICIVACAFSTLQKMNTWTSDTLDNIVETGTHLYLKSRQIPENRCVEHLTPSHIYKYFYVDVLKISMGLGVDTMSDRIARDSTMLEKVELLLGRFFERYPSGIFSNGNTYFAIWKMDRYHFLFDPTEHQRNGDRWCGLPGSGYCYCIRSWKTKFLAEVIVKNCTLKQFNKFLIQPCCVEKLVKINVTPPEHLEDSRPCSVSVDITCVTKQNQQGVPKEKKPQQKQPKAEEKTQPPKPETSDVPVEKKPSKPQVQKKPSEPKLPPKRPSLQIVTQYEELVPNTVGILRASTHQRDPNFTKYMGAQSLSNAVAVLTMLRQFKSKRWVRSALDAVLKFGEQIHHDMKKLPEGDFPTKITLNGVDYSLKMVKYGVIGRIVSDDDRILSLSDALRNCLIDHDCCIINAPNVLAVWREEDRFYMFDPEPRSPTGRVLQAEQQGLACITCWVKVDDMVKLYLANLPKNTLKERFTLILVQIKDYSPLAEDWYNFKSITLTKWILRGHFSQRDGRFPRDSRNSQCTANAAMALTYKELKEEKDWSSETIDQVLISGDDYYRSCVEYLTESGKFKDKYLMVDELKRSFQLENKKVELDIEDCAGYGVLTAKNSQGVQGLEKGLEDFFTSNDTGIFTANLQSMAVWKRDDVYYYCDSHSRDARGVVTGFGTACVLRMTTIEDLAKSLLVNLGADPKNIYNIGRIEIRLVDIADDGIVQQPLNNYEAINDSVAILRSKKSCKKDETDVDVENKPEVPACLMAVGLNTITPCSTWSKEDVDLIVDLGDDHYAISMQEKIENSDEDFDRESYRRINTNDVQKSMQIGSNVVQVEFQDVAFGNFEENLKESLEGLGSKSEQEGVEAFQSILESTWMNVSLWRDEDLYYLFDPSPRDERGQVYGKDEWSVKVQIVPEEEAKEEEEAEGVEGKEGVVGKAGKEGEEEKKDDQWKEDEEKDEMAGGDNNGEEQEEKVVQDTTYEEEAKKNVEDEAGEREDEAEGGEDEAEGGEEEEPQVVEKQGSEYWRTKEKEGKACVMRFGRLNDLIAHILENVPPNKRQEIEYSLRGIQIVSNAPKVHEVADPEEMASKKDEVGENGEEVQQEPIDEFLGDWNDFKETDYGRWILRGSKNFNDALYPACNRGKQSIPMCLVMLSLVNIYDLSKCTGKIVDVALAFGDRLFTVVKKLRTNDLKGNKQLGLTNEEIEMIVADTAFELKDYPNKVCIGEKMSTWEVNFAVVAGDTTSKVPEAVHNLNSGIGKFFEEHTFGILINRNYPVAIWKDDKVSYMFDPHPNGPSGTTSPMGVACITRFKELDHLVETYLTDLPKVGDHFFEIHALKFEHEKCVRARHAEEKVERAPKIGGFNSVTAGKFILRGDVKLDYTKFSGGVNVHSSAIAFVALALSLNKDPDTWTHIIINEIVTFGEELYNLSVAKLLSLGDKFDPWSDRLDICKVDTDFKIGSLKVNTAIRFKEQKGIVDVKNSKTLNLRQGIEKFFEENSHGILIADKFLMAIWEQVKGKDAYIYMFDPNSRGGTGLPGQGGLPCVMKFINSKLASDHIMSCMMDVDKTKAVFAIVPVEIVVGAARSKRKPCKCSPEVVKLTNKCGVSSSSKTTAERTAKEESGTTRTTLTNKCGVSSSSKTTAERTSKEASGTTRTTMEKSHRPEGSTMTSSKKPCPCPNKSTGRGTRPSPNITVRNRCGNGGVMDSRVVPESCKPKHIPTKPTTCPDQKTILEEKRLLRQMAEEKRAKEEKRRCAIKGRKEYHEINSGQSIIRGFRFAEKHRELPINLSAFVFMKLMPDLDKWTYTNIEMIIEAGNQLYFDSHNTYKPPGPKLNLQHVLRRIVITDHCAKFEIKMPIIGQSFTRDYLLAHLNQFFLLTNFCILNYEDALVSIYFKKGYFYLFDPYRRDLQGNALGKDDVGGSAVMIRFGELSDLVDKLLKNFRNPEEKLQKKYALIVVKLECVDKVPQASMRPKCK